MSSYRRKSIVKVTGYREVDRMLKTLAPKVANKVTQGAFKKGGKLVLATARTLVPIDSGTLKRSLRLKVGRSGRSGRLRAGARVLADQKAAAKLGQQAYYAHMIEFGTRFTPPRPFLQPALDQHRSAIEKFVAQDVGDAVREA